MTKRTRREFIRQTGAGVAGLATLNLASTAATAACPDRDALPPHRVLEVPGVHAYPDSISVAAGQPISFHVSSSVPYRLSICRLGLKMDDPGGDEVLHEFPEAQARVQPIHPGSYLHVEKALRGRLRALTIEIWVRPWKLGRRMGLIGQYEALARSGFELSVEPSGEVRFALVTGAAVGTESLSLFSSQTLRANQWQHVVATWDGQTAALWLNGAPVGQAGFVGEVIAPKCPLRLAAAGGATADDFLDADLAMPVIYNRALRPDEITERFAQQGLRPAKGNHVIACWPLTEEKGDRVADVSGGGHHGRIINHATWMIGGPGFNADVPRYGHYDPAGDPKRGHALRFASDDLYDCRWAVTHRYRIPANAKPGMHVGRIRFELDSNPHLYHVTFIVRKAKRRKPAPILLLCATNTWKAYSATPFGRNLPDLKQVWGTNGIENSPGDPPAYCFYRGHAAARAPFNSAFACRGRPPVRTSSTAA
jgi:hypothetical protein